MRYPVLLLACLAVGCSASQADALRCEHAAVKAVLPDDPDQLSLGDLKDVQGRLHACKAQGDAGG
jgi:hypothetical protein